MCPPDAVQRAFQGLAALQDGGHLPPSTMKEISPLELVGRFVARFAAVSGVIALLVWVTWVMLDIRNLQSGFTLP